MDDACLQAVYEAADDPAICDRLYLPGVVPTCKAYYADPNRVPRLLTPTPIPDDARLGWLAYVLDGDIWIKYLPDGQPQRITDDDGAMLAELRVIPVDGGDPVTVAARDLMAEGSMALGGWSPQGKTVAPQDDTAVTGSPEDTP